MFAANFILAMTVIVGMMDGKQVALENPRFTGFIESRDSGDAILLYREGAVHGELKVSAIQRMDFAYKKGKPFMLSITLKDGKKMEVTTARAFVSVKGDTATGTATIDHPSPTSAPTRLSSRAPNRKNDLTIQYLEFPR